MTKNHTGIFIFAIIYNILGLMGLTACAYGFQALRGLDTLVIGQADITQSVSIIVTTLLFTSSYLIIDRNPIGYLLPVFILSFFISGGFVILIPLLLIHIFFFTNPNVATQFSL